jgi:hypothetical protein
LERCDPGFVSLGGHAKRNLFAANGSLDVGEFELSRNYATVLLQREHVILDPPAARGNMSGTGGVRGLLDTVVKT